MLASSSVLLKELDDKTEIFLRIGSDERNVGWIAKKTPNVFETFRDRLPHYFRRLNGYPIADAVLQELKARGIEEVRIHERLNELSNIYSASLESYLKMEVFQEQNFEPQRCFPLREMTLVAGPGYMPEQEAKEEQSPEQLSLPIMSVDYSVYRGKPIIHLFCRTPDGKREYRQFHGLEPYFYVPENEPVPKVSGIVRVERGRFMSLYGERLKKVVVDIPKTVRDARSKFVTTFEADILFANRFLIDKVVEIQRSIPRVNFIDIEVDDQTGFPNMDTAEQPIISISCWDSILQKDIVFIWRNDLTLKEEKKEGESVYYFPDENSMMKTFIAFIGDTDPDLISGWNVNSFDLNYIVKRLKVLKLDPNELSSLGFTYTTFEMRKGQPYIDVNIKGRAVFDLLLAYKQLNFNETRSNKLDAVGEFELGMKKLPITSVGKLWREDLSKLIEYNKRDVEICRKINDKKKLIDFYDEKRRLAICTWKDTFGPTRFVDCYILKFCKGKWVLPTKQEKKGSDEQHEGLKGAIVLPPKYKGVIHNVFVSDLKSLYPSIMVSFNMSPETVHPQGEINIGNGTCFRKDIPGMIPQVFDKLFQQRAKYKAMMKQVPRGGPEHETLEQQQYAVKVASNTIFGAIGNQYFRLFKPEIAAAITHIGREIITESAKMVDGLNIGTEVVYADTDSNFTKVSDLKCDEEVIQIGKEVTVKLNEFYGNFAKSHGLEKHSFSMEFDKVFKAVFFSGKKKRYAGHVVYEDGQPVDYLLIKGFESRRSDSSLFAEKLQKELFELILKKQLSKEEIMRYTKQKMALIKDGKVSLKEIGLPKGIKKDLKDYKVNSPWVRGTVYANRFFKLNIGRGSKPKLLWLSSSGPNPETDVICFEDEETVPPGFVLDMEKMIEMNVQAPMQRIFDALAWNIEEVINGQKSLAGWNK